MYHCHSGCANDFAQCSIYKPSEPSYPGEPEVQITFDDCCTNNNGCCNGFPITWPPRPDINPQMICKDCGCIYEMFRYDDDCFPPTPDFSEIDKHGYQLQICEPNACNEIYFKFYRTRCIPPRICCKCPICRRRRRAGDHFRDCSCTLCVSRREKCLNRLRREMLAKHSKECHHCGGRIMDLPPCCIPKPESCEENSPDEKECAEGDGKADEEAPKGNGENVGDGKDSGESTESDHRKSSKLSENPESSPSTCPCHLYIPSYWEVKEPCQQRQDYEKEKVQMEKQAEEEAKMEREKKNSGVGKFLTDSFSQLTWSLGPFLPSAEPCPEPEPESEPCPGEEDTEVKTNRKSETASHDSKRDSTNSAKPKTSDSQPPPPTAVVTGQPQSEEQKDEAEVKGDELDLGKLEEEAEGDEELEGKGEEEDEDGDYDEKRLPKRNTSIESASGRSVASSSSSEEEISNVKSSISGKKNKV